MNNSILGLRICNARMRLKQQENATRAQAMQRYRRGQRRKIAAAMITLIALAVANLWAAAQGWGL
jgi:hypothetical protein